MDLPGLPFLPAEFHQVSVHKFVKSASPTIRSTHVILTLARDNRVQDVRKCIEAGLSPINFANAIGQTALHVAALHGNKETVEVLLDLGIDVNIRNSRGDTALHFAAAAKCNAEHICKLLIDGGADPRISDKFGNFAYERAQNEDLRLLLGGPNPQLFEYARQGQVEELKLLLDKDTHALKMGNSDGQTALHLGAFEGHANVVNLLLGLGAQTDARDADGKTPLHCAVHAGHIEIVGLLLAADANPEAPTLRLNPYTNGQWLNRNSKETLDPFDQTPLHIAAEIGDTQIASLLLKAGANVNAVDFDGKSPLHTALEQNDAAMIDVLASYGVDVDSGNGDYASPLHYLASRGRAKLIKQILAYGASADIATKDGWTPLHLAARTGSKEAVAVLLDAGCNAEAANNHGNTALHMAAVNGKTEVCQLLLRNSKAGYAALNNDGKSPAELASSCELKALIMNAMKEVQEGDVCE